MNNIQINFLDEQSSELDMQKAYELCKNVSHEIFGFNISIYGGLEEFFSKVREGTLYVLTARVQEEVS